VVDTTNYSGKGMIATSAATARIRGIHESLALHVVERFQRVDANTLSYEVAIEDPNVYAAPWKVSLPLTRDANYLIYEYACHEGNYAMEGILRAGRTEEKAAAAAKVASCCEAGEPSPNQPQFSISPETGLYVLGPWPNGGQTLRPRHPRV
jgi:hypothetical protein